MKCFYKRIIAGLFAVVTLFFTCIPHVYASGIGVGDVLGVIDALPGDYWSWAERQDNRFFNWFKSILDEDVCSKSPNTNGRHNFKEQRTTVNGKTGLFYICEYCGRSAGEVGEEAYQQQVSELPATGYDSDGRLRFPLTVKRFSPASSRTQITYSQPGTIFSVAFVPVVNYDSSVYCFFEPFIASIAGDYQLCFTFINSSTSYYLHGKSPFGGVSISDFFGGPGIKQLVIPYTRGGGVGTQFIKDDDFFVLAARVNTSGQATGYWEFLCTPYTAPSGDQYNINTRPTTITGGNYGIVGDDGTINTVTNNSKIVNETTNNYYNPATGETKPILDWSYNYENRTYDLTLDTGDKVSVEYGDQNITITENTVVEGNTIVNNYTIYYMIEGSDPPCDHTWQAGEPTAPTCISPGKTLNTCTKCGATSVDITPALGHDWQVLRTVLTEYDEDGSLIQAGYTIYQCTRCGEQYKDADSTGPPTPPSTGTNDGGLLEFLNGIVKYLSDNLSGAVELLQRFFSEIPKLFDGFTAFLAAVFPYLPDEIMLLFTFGIAALVFVGVLKAIRR